MPKDEHVDDNAQTFADGDDEGHHMLILLGNQPIHKDEGYDMDQ